MISIDTQEDLLPGEIWGYKQFAQFLRESHPHGPKLKPLEFPKQIDIGTIGKTSDRLIITTNKYLVISA